MDLNLSKQWMLSKIICFNARVFVYFLNLDKNWEKGMFVSKTYTQIYWVSIKTKQKDASRFLWLKQTCTRSTRTKLPLFCVSKQKCLHKRCSIFIKMHVLVLVRYIIHCCFWRCAKQRPFYLDWTLIFAKWLCLL